MESIARMPLSDKQRELVEDCIMDLHFTSQKCIENEKEMHRKLFELNIEDAVELLGEIAEDMQDDEKVHDYKIHLFLPFQVYELLQLRERASEEAD